MVGHKGEILRLRTLRAINESVIGVNENRETITLPTINK